MGTLDGESGTALRPRISVPSAMAIVLVLLLSLAVAVPFLDDLVVGEEGIFAYMAVDNGRPWQGGFHDVFFTGGRLGGRELVLPPVDHPSPPYLFVRYLLRGVVNGIVAVTGLGAFDTWTLATKSLIARLPFFLLYAVSFLSVGMIAGYVMRRELLAAVPPLALIACLGTLPLMIGGAVSPMYDGNVGTFMYALSAACLCAASGVATARARNSLLMAAGFSAAIGKNEWGITFLAALFVAAAVRWIVVRFVLRETDQLKHATLALVAGFCLGTAANFALGPDDFIGGLRLMLHVADITQTSSYREVLAQRWPWIWPLFLLAPYAVLLMLIHREKLVGPDFPLLVLGLWGLATFCAFALSKWIGNGFPRYFCPAAFAIGAFVVAMMRYRMPRLAEVAVMAVALALVGANLAHLREKYVAGVSIAEMPGLALSEREAFYRKAYAAFRATGQPQIGDVSLAYFYPDIDMSTGVASLDWLREELDKRHGKSR